jgi:hypothetical protein
MMLYNLRCGTCHELYYFGRLPPVGLANACNLARSIRKTCKSGPCAFELEAVDGEFTDIDRLRTGEREDRPIV